MKQSQPFNAIMLGGAAVLMAIQPAFATPTQVTAVKVNPTPGGVNVFLKTNPGERPQVFAVNRNNAWTADITSAQLRLQGSSNFSQENPAPGIARVTVAPLTADSVRVTVVGQKGAPVGQVLRPSEGGVMLSFSPAGTKPPVATPVPANLPQVNSAQQPLPAPRTVAQVPVPPPGVPQPVGVPPGGPVQPLVPNPRVSVQDTAPAGSLPALPRAIAPPVGDIAISQFNPVTNLIDLGTAERVPRLVLRDAPAREVLALLARAAGLNLAYAPPRAIPGQTPAPAQPGAGPDEGPKVTLDVENEAVQDVFNTVLQITGLEANRVGRTIYVGTRLPDDARNVLTRTLRLNQARATTAANYLVSQGAELQLPITRVTIVPIGPQGPNQVLTRVEEPDIKAIRAQRGDAPLPLNGLAVSVDERLNSIVISGTPRKIEVATALLSQLDARRRQVAINVRVIDVNLTNFERLGFSFSFGVGQNRFLNTGGVGVFNFGTAVPGVNTFVQGADPLGSQPVGLANPVSIANFASNFFAQLQAQIVNGNAKILTDPTLVVQEGQTARVNLTQEVLSNIETEISGSGDGRTITITTEKAEAGITVNVVVDQIDDNGFINLAVNPVISAPTSTVTIQVPQSGSQQITLLQKRELESGRIRLRDGQTLIAAGIIQDADRVSISKVPILGDIPILGALFRRTERNNQRQEVIMILTPRILDDSDRSTFGYNYTPGPGVRQILEPKP